jgi:hypothetical protein
MPKATTSHVITATASPTSPRRPVPRKPAKRATAVIRADAVYSWAELRRRLGWAEHSGRQARTAGLRLVTFGRQKYCLGEDVLAFFRKLADRQQAAAARGGE